MTPTEFNSEPPAAPDAEAVFLGSLMLLTGPQREIAMANVSVDDFSTGANRITFEAIRRLADRGESADPAAVLTELQHTGRVSTWPTPSASVGLYLHGLVEVVPVPLAYSVALRGVREASARRRIHRSGLRLAEAAGADGFESLTSLVEQETAALKSVVG